MKAYAVEQNLIIREQEGKELIIDKPNKCFYMKCKARDIQRQGVEV